LYSFLLHAQGVALYTARIAEMEEMLRHRQKVLEYLQRSETATKAERYHAWREVGVQLLVQQPLL
jgi:hypothetical protein